MNEKVLNDFLKRTKGEFYLGIVGSVRSGKSSFIKKFMDLKVLPYVNDEFIKNKILDEIPQSSDGKTIMTVEPKFIPSNTININIENDIFMNVRLVDSVGWLIPNAIGHFTDEGPRMVKTPWFEDSIPFKEAAEIGTKKIIQNHSTLGILMTSDGSFGEFAREDYMTCEDILVNELKSYNKPFVVVLNSKNPNGKEAVKIKKQIEDKHQVPCVIVDVLKLNNEDVDKILKEALNEFGISEIDMKLPNWITVLEKDNKYKKDIDDVILNTTQEFKKFKHVNLIKDKLKECIHFKNVILEEIDPSIGKITIKVDCNEEIYQEIIDDLLGDTINSKGDFIRMLQDYRTSQREYSGIKEALEMVRKTGYGISLPSVNDMKLTKPEIIKQGNRYGVKLKAVGSSIHLIKVDVESTFEPIIGSEEQSKMIIDNLISDDLDPNNIWESEIFGRKLSELVNDGIKSKLHLLPQNAQYKFRDTLEKVVNKGNGKLIAIIL